uniref:Cytochrome P450 n=2 Tax=Kalanchoe fedtschenkoi TaxID=63787 RepID=A0A7N0TAY7_KALFE
MMDMVVKLPSVNPVILVCTALLCSLAFLYVRSRSSRHSSSDLPPSPWRLPIIGNLHQLGGSAHQSLHVLSLEHGPLMLVHFGLVPMFVVSSGELAREVLKTREVEFPGRLNTEAYRILFEGGEDKIFGPAWTQIRKVCVSEVLSLKRIQALQFIREEELRRLADERRPPADLSDLFLTLASTTLSRAVLGLESAEQGGGRESNRVIGQLVREASNLLNDVVAFGAYIPALSWLDNLRGLYRKTKRVSQAIHEFLDRVIDERLEIRRRSEAGEGGEQETGDRKYFVDILLELQTRKDVMGGHELTRMEIRAILLVMFIAGIDSSVITLEQTMKELVKNPRIMRKLQQEIRSVVGNKSEIHQSDLSRMEYLKCVVKETLRLHVPPMVTRQASDKDSKLGGFQIPANAAVLINMWAIHMDPATWDRPLEFLPERFLNTRYDFTGQDDKYFPFSLGRRICPGVQFAMFSIEYALAHVLCWFDWELPDEICAQSFGMSEDQNLPLRLVPLLHKFDGASQTIITKIKGLSNK